MLARSAPCEYGGTDPFLRRARTPMTDDIRMAFAHPSERAEASAEGPRDRISLRDYVIEVEIGAFQQERGHLQRVRFNVVVEVAPLSGPIDDDVDRILSYDRVTEAIAAEVGAERINLLETLAARVAERILREPPALRVFVRIEKLDRGPFALGVEIVRAKGELPVAGRDHVSHPHPRVVYLTNPAIGSAHLSGWLDQLAAGPLPVLVCVGPADVAAPQSAAPLAQRRIDLLAIEQNAWVLAGRDKRCLVVGTRTELDWAMKNGQICVWAPSKIVLDAHAVAVTPRDIAALVGWFATEMDAQEILVVGDAAISSDTAIRVVDVGQARLE
jgi:dihydroneopterin aldolase